MQRGTYLEYGCSIRCLSGNPDLCIPALKAWPLLRIRCSMASGLNLIPAFLSDNLDRSR